jgi:hypothetical protein
MAKTSSSGYYNALTISEGCLGLDKAIRGEFESEGRHFTSDRDASVQREERARAVATEVEPNRSTCHVHKLSSEREESTAQFPEAVKGLKHACITLRVGDAKRLFRRSLLRSMWRRRAIHRGDPRQTTTEYAIWGRCASSCGTRRRMQNSCPC